MIYSFVSHLILSHFLGHEQRTKAGPNSAEKGDGTKYPIETYQGLEEATAERIKRFEDETKAMLMRNSRSDLTPATPEMGRTTSGNVILMYHIFLLITRVILNNIIEPSTIYNQYFSMKLYLVFFLDGVGNGSTT